MSKKFEHSILRSQRGNTVLAVQLLVGFVISLWLIWEAIGLTAGYVAHKVPDRWESKMFSGLATAQGWKAVAYSKEEKKAQKIFDHLLKKNKMRDLDYKLYFIDSDAPNAFAIPGGTIAVTKGLLKLVKGDIGLATVIGHEFGHIHHRHSLEAMGHSLLLGGLLFITIGGDYGFLTASALSLAQRKNSRNQETEADEFGITQIYNTYGKTTGAYEFFEKLAADPKTKGSKMGAMLSSHPYTPDRLEHMKKFAWRLKKKTKNKKARRSIERN